MRLPIVSRSTLDAAHGELAYLREMLRDERAQYARLAEQVVTLANRAVPEQPKMPERTRDEVIEAIMARAGNNGQLRAHLSAWAMRQRRAQVPDDQIINGIIVWESPDEDESR